MVPALPAKEEDMSDRTDDDQKQPLVLNAPIFENFRPTKPKIVQGQVVQPAGMEITFWIPLSEAEGKMERVGRLYGQVLTSVIVDFPEQLVLGLAPVSITSARRGREPQRRAKESRR